MGFDEAILNRLTVRIAEFFLFKGIGLVFGHDWRENGVMRAVAGLAETAASGEQMFKDRDHGTMVLNLVPTAGRALSQAAVDATEAAQGILQVRSIIDWTAGDNDLPDGWEKDRCGELWVLRRALNRVLNPGARICLGGKRTGFSGYYAGVAEEAYFALATHKPLYLVGGFGGVTEDVIDALTGQSDFKFTALSPLDQKRDESICKDVARMVDLPLDGLAGGTCQ